MRTQIITALSIVAVLGAAGGAYAVNQSVLGTALVEETVIGSATPVLVPVEPKGDDIPEEYLRQLERASAAEQTATPVAPPAPVATGSGGYDDDHGDDDDDDDDDEDEDDEDEPEDDDDEDDEDESDDDD